MVAVRGDGGRFVRSAEPPRIHHSGGTVLAGPTRGYPGEADGLPRDVPEDRLRVFARKNVLGLAAGHWGDVPKSARDLEACLRKGLVQIEGPGGEPGYAKLPPRTCCGNPATPGQH